ncbi:MAG: HAMP domain-containing sensor histidine kinase [Ignavibacteriales bacterium]
MNKLVLTNTTRKNILWLFASLVIIYLIFNTFTYFELSYLLEESIDSRLKHELEHISSAVGFYNDTLFIKNGDEFQETDLVEVTQTPFFLKVYNAKGKLLFTSENTKKISDYSVALPNKFEENYAFRDFDFYNEELRVGFFRVTDRAKNELGVIELATFKSTSKILANSLLLFNLITFPFFLLMFILISYFFVKSSFAPINRIIDLANEISASNISKRLTYEADENDELGKLKTTLNNLFERLESQINQISHFSDNASHQLMTPLTSLKSEIEFLEKQNGLSSAQFESIKILHEQTERMIKIVRTMLILARESDNCDCKKNIFNLSKLLDEISRQYNNSRLDFTYEKNIFLRGREDYFSMVLQNLIDNAIKYSHEESTVKIEVLTQNEEVKITVSDQGIGIADEEKDKIFDRFFRGSSVESDSKGFGLGLSLVKNIVNKMDGQVKIESNNPSGSKFIISLPSVKFE